MKKTFKTLTLAAAFAIATMSSMVSTTEAARIIGVGCSSGGSNCEVDLGLGWVWIGGIDWILIEY